MYMYTYIYIYIYMYILYIHTYTLNINRHIYIYMYAYIYTSHDLFFSFPPLMMSSVLAPLQSRDTLCRKSMFTGVWSMLLQQAAGIMPSRKEKPWTQARSLSSKAFQSLGFKLTMYLLSPLVFPSNRKFLSLTGLLSEWKTTPLFETVKPLPHPLYVQRRIQPSTHVWIYTSCMLYDKHMGACLFLCSTWVHPISY